MPDELNELLTVLREIRDLLDAGSAEVLDPAGAARFLGISVSKVHQLNAAGELPSPAELGERCPRWSRTELKAWLFAGAPGRSRWEAMRHAALRGVA
jgi:predicted DNA-binding transcriptional regulator AlpA